MSLARRLSRVLPCVLAIACTKGVPGPRGEESGRVQALVVRPRNDSVRDTTRFEAAAVAHRCAGTASLVLDGVANGNGVLLWLRRPPDSPLSGDYRYAAPGDTAGLRSAVAVLRFMVEGLSRGAVLDSGRLTVTESAARLSGSVRGSGVSSPGAVRVSADVDFQAVPTPRDTVTCEVEP